MEYRGIRYDVKMAAGQDQWVWTVHTPKPKQGKVAGSRVRAVLAAEKAIKEWCYQHADECQPGGAMA